MIWDEFLRHFRFCDEEDSGLSDEEQERKGSKNRPKHTRKRIHQVKKNFLEKFKTASYHLLQDIPNCKSKTEKSVTKKQGRIIADLLNRLNLIEYKEKESFLDYMDGERIRVSLKNYLMQYDSIDDIIKAI